MLKIGITGQSGFIGTHLYNTLGLFPEKYKQIPFEDEYFLNSEKLDLFVNQCDAIVHLAAINRHHDPQVILNTNLGLINQLIDTCEKTGSTPSIVFSSSIHEKYESMYGISKREGRKLFEQWALKNNTCFTGIAIPNVFGPFSLPFYTSVVATFCYQLTHNEIPHIVIDNNMEFIYIGELVSRIIDIIEGKKAGTRKCKIFQQN